MFDLLTILTLLAPAVLAPPACLMLVRAIGRAEASREAPPVPARPAQIVLDAAAAPVVAERVRERSVA
jgi:hypothetical protein